VLTLVGDAVVDSGGDEFGALFVLARSGRPAEGGAGFHRLAA